MFRFSSVLLLVCSLAGYAHAACQVMSWNQKWFDADAVHYAAGDLDGDGVPEIISASTTTVAYRRPPEFAAFTVYTSTAIGAPVAADVNTDGKIDLLIPNTGNNTLVVLPGNGNGTFDAAKVTPLGVTPARFVLGNFSGNAYVDVALIGNSSSLIFLQGNGTGAFTQVGTVAVASSPFHLVKANFDGDGYDDVAVSHASSSTVEVVFANGSGGAAATWTLESGASALLAAADYESDGDTDLYSVTADGLAVFPRVAPRKFDSAVSRYGGWQQPRSIALVDLDNDLDLDLVVGSPGWASAVLRTPGGQSGEWTTGSSEQLHPFVQKNNVRSIAAADFTGDGKIDIAVENAAAGYGGLLVNECGTVSAGVVVQSVITLGQTAAGSVAASSAAFPSPTGSVRVSWNGGEKTLTLTPYQGWPYASASLTIDGLPLGFQPIVADYSGDATYPPATDTWWVTVTNETTTTQLTGPARWIYGERPTFKAIVTSSTGDTPTGYVYFRRDGSYFGDAPAPVAEKQLPILKAGSRKVSAHFDYSDTHPPSSASMDVTVDKATSQVSFSFGAMSRAGESASIGAWLRPQFFSSISGTLSLMEGETTLATATVNPSYADQSLQFSVNGLGTGTHRLRIVYPGDQNLEGSSLEFDHTVFPADTGVRIAATAEANRVKLDYLAVSSASHRVYRQTASTSWTYIGSGSSLVFWDYDVVPGTTYQYRIDAVVNNAVVGQSNIETVYVGAFTDANLSGIKIKKLHFTELQTALNTFRTMASLPLLQIDFTGTIKAAHITQMRNYVNEARTALGMPAISFGADPVARVTRIRGADLHQLRDALR